MTNSCYSALQLKSDWHEQADSLLEHPEKHGKCIVTPGIATAPMKVSFTPKKREHGEPWDNTYIYHQNGASSSKAFNLIETFKFPTVQDINNCEAKESDFDAFLNNVYVNLGWQLLTDGGFRIWNRSAKDGQGEWLKIGINIPPIVAGQQYKIINSFVFDETRAYYLGLAVFDQYYQLNIGFPNVRPKPNVVTHCNNAIQLDSKGQGLPINFELIDCNLVGF